MIKKFILLIIILSAKAYPCMNLDEQDQPLLMIRETEENRAIPFIISDSSKIYTIKKFIEDGQSIFPQTEIMDEYLFRECLKHAKTSNSSNIVRYLTDKHKLKMGIFDDPKGYFSSIDRDLNRKFRKLDNFAQEVERDFRREILNPIGIKGSKDQALAVLAVSWAIISPNPYSIGAAIAACINAGKEVDPQIIRMMPPDYNPPKIHELQRNFYELNQELMRQEEFQRALESDPEFQRTMSKIQDDLDRQFRDIFRDRPPMW
jgi:hypothetical protein